MCMGSASAMEAPVKGSMEAWGPHVMSEECLEREWVVSILGRVKNIKGAWYSVPREVS